MKLKLDEEEKKKEEAGMVGCSSEEWKDYLQDKRWEELNTYKNFSWVLFIFGGARWNKEEKYVLINHGPKILPGESITANSVKLQGKRTFTYDDFVEHLS
tara:strand:- start:55 stop:354 length:300 start_codon:yes stop_codon:yes gene_type:complete